VDFLLHHLLFHLKLFHKHRILHKMQFLGQIRRLNLAGVNLSNRSVSGGSRAFHSFSSFLFARLRTGFRSASRRSLQLS
jgi:hypothetical protein